jgi:hypothetical protein
MRILVSKALTLLHPSDRLAGKGIDGKSIGGAPDAFRHQRNGSHCTGKVSKIK